MGHLHNYRVHVPSALTMDLKTPCNYMYKYM